MNKEQFLSRVEYIVRFGSASLVLGNVLSACAEPPPPSRPTIEPARTVTLPAKEMKFSLQTAIPTFRRIEKKETPIPTPFPTPETPTITPDQKEVARQKFGDNAIKTESRIDPLTLYFTIAEYRPDAAQQLAPVFEKNRKRINIDIALIIAIQEGSFAVNNNPDGKNNIGNVKDKETGEMKDFDSLAVAMQWLIGVIDKYPEKFNVYTFEQMMPIYAPPSAQERIPVGEEFLTRIREISKEFKRGEITKAELPEKIHQLRLELQGKHGKRWV